MASVNAEALLVFGLINIRYLSGFTGSEATLCLDNDRSRILCDSRYTTQATLECAGCEVTEYRLKGEGIAGMITGQGWRRVAFDAEKIPVAMFNSLVAALPSVEFVPLAGELDELRSVKSATEIEAVADSCALASAAFVQLVKLIRPGITERELALELEILMRRAGADGMAFDFIVASGDRGALPHGVASNKVIEKGELVTVDFGVRCNGYHSDETVTVAIGCADDRQREVFAVVKEAHDLALQAVRPGVTCRELDAIARQSIDRHGLGGFFRHGLGHGVGLEIHESPTLAASSEQIVREGMVFTIEPGVYIPGWGGVRIEDTVVVTAEGCRLLTQVSKELIIAG
jgi:Xaa-Pro aminopeptidase